MKIGVLGGGQLARMLALAGYPLGIQVICVDPSTDCCAKPLCPVLHTDYHDADQISKYFLDVDCVTYETENLPMDAVEPLINYFKIYPSIEALRITQDRLLEKDFLNSLHIPTAKYLPIDTADDLNKATQHLRFPFILKTRQNGYDGKGQTKLLEEYDLLPAWQASIQRGLILEEVVTFERELSLIFARDIRGKMVFYPLTLNQHQDGILRRSEAPFLHDELQMLAQAYAQTIANQLQYIGIMAIEFFHVDNQLIVNELAPRVHNSGHWTIEGAVTSQFENHLRAICGLPLGSTAPCGLSTMLNIIGEEPNNLNALLSIPNVHYHTYGKAPRANRKLGHVTICTEKNHQMEQSIQLIHEAQSALNSIQTAHTSP